MINCNRDFSRRLLRDELTPDEVSQFEIHLETCSQCRLSVEAEAGSVEDWHSTRLMLESSAEVPYWPDLTAEHPRCSPENYTEEKASGQAAIDLSILSPSDDPHSMGRIGNYEISGIIGRGGMGIVFRALDQSLSRNVAIKVLDPSLAAVGAARERFAREARAMAAVSHEHVVPVYTVDEHRGLPYFAMEYVAGGTLEARIRQDGPLDVLSIVRIARQVALALSAAHDCGLVHRDIKPGNILLDRGIERVRVTDFGLARVSDEASYTRSGLVVGTPQFMAPEQVRGEMCDARSDLFSLGSVVYAMCTGHSPFRAESLYGAMQRIVHDAPHSIREQNPCVPEWLERFVDRLLAKEPSDRFDSAATVAQLLETEQAYLQNPGQMSAPSRNWMHFERPRRQTNASRKSLILSAAISACLLFVVAWKVWPTATNDHPTPSSKVSKTSELPIVFYGLLWNADGAGDLAQSANALEKSMYDDSQRSSDDAWSLSIKHLQQRMNQFERENP